MITNYYDLDMIPCGVYPLVMVSQYDSAREIVFRLFEEKEEYIPNSAKILIGTDQFDATVNGNEVSFVVPSSLTEETNSLFGEVWVTKDGNMGSLNFRFKVDSTPIKTVPVIETQTLSIKPNIGLIKPILLGNDAITMTIAEPNDEDIIDDPIEEDEVNDELVNDNQNDN